ncbi:MAG: hypothetical protein IKP73_04515 [Bacteroidales bacterium]|nr:hypothetical protein [Bacteroidales bacterium]
MLRTHYSTRPTAMDMNAFTLIYRWDIREFQMPTDNGEPYVDYSAYVVRINAPFSQNKLIEAVMTLSTVTILKTNSSTNTMPR